MKLLQTLAITASMLLTTAVVSQTAINGSVVVQPCNNNGVLSVTVSGLSSPVSYTYYVSGNPPVYHSSVTGLTDQLTGLGGSVWPWGNNASYVYVTASDGSGSAYANFTLTPAFNFSVNVIPANCPALCTVAVTFTGGTAPFIPVWTNLSTNITTTGNTIPLANGNYSLTVTDGAGCLVSTATGSGNINVMSNSSIAGGIAVTPANCTNGSATVSASGGTAPYSYQWQNNGNGTTISGMSQGNVWCTVTDALGCQKTFNAYITQNVFINYNSTVQNATCLQNNGGVTSFVNGGTAPYSFLWSNAATTQNLSGVTGGQYTVQVTDANGCVGYGYAYVGMSTPVTVTYTSTPSSCTSPTGGSTVTPAGGTAPYSVLWYLFPSNVTAPSISGKPAGTYNFKITDASGCIRTGAAVIPPASTLNAIAPNITVTCPATTGNIAAYASGSNPPFTYQWSNSVTTATNSNVPLGLYTCTITDNVGCKVVKNGFVSQVSPVQIGFNTTPVSCVYSSNGTAHANAFGGTAPYTYSWSTSQTLPTITGLSQGNYWVTATDASGCKSTSMTAVANSGLSTSCYCTITGTVYNDANTDCVKGFGENGIGNIMVHCSGFGSTWTNNNGVYAFQVPSGSYTVTEIVQPQKYPLSPCQSNSHAVTVTAGPNCVTTVNFANTVVPVSDLRIANFYVNPPIPGNSYQHKTVIYNDGTVTENTVKFGYVHDGQLSYSSSIPWSISQQNASSYPNWYSINSGFPSLAPNTWSQDNFFYGVPSNIPLGTQVTLNDTVAKSAPIATSWLTDNTPWNNVAQHYATVVGSFDPNFKEVSPIGTGTNGGIFARDSVLTYAIHFQNEGTWYAQNIVVTDTIDASLNVNSISPGYATHNYRATVSDNGVLTFRFDNINLPYKSAFGDVLSSGMVTYSIKTKKNLAVGTKIRNKAAIYFDFNEPVITNTTLNTIIKQATANGIDELHGYGNTNSIYPNPAADSFSLMFDSKNAGDGSLVVYDLSGRVVLARDLKLAAGTNVIGQTLSGVSSGVYIVTLKSDDVQYSKKLVIAK